jgi:16S rRNA (cytosine1402-N4)-methyltransferase
LNESAPNIPDPRPPRRPRYQGAHPRRFEEKYKELNPEKYATDVARVLASGKTPAGMHRPIMVREVLEVLAPRPGEVGVDCTLGYGGHAAELLQKLTPGGRLIAFDADPIELPKTEARLRAMGFGPEAFVARRSNFAGLPQALVADGIAGADLVLADLGLSSMQMDNPARGFTFKHEGPLDLRMNPERGQPASNLVARLGEDELCELLAANADEPHARLIARSIIQARDRGPLATTTALAAVVRKALQALSKQDRQQEGDAPVRRVFQALRIAVNDEFGALETLLRQLPACLKPGGRAAILSFHSGEDRRVKKAFQAGKLAGAYSVVAEDVTRADEAEVRSNPRAASAKLRWAIRSGK